jgi:inositol-1,3,4-trisphosphate 5/6-kinase/inositol-tetrakisphosphate 1-kinase
MTKIRIAFCGPPGKWERMGWQSFISYASLQSIEVFHLDLTKPIAEQGPFSLIIHKLTFVMRGHDMTVDPGLESLYMFGKSHPEIPIVDDLDSVAVTMDREEMNTIFRSIKWPDGIHVYVPGSRMLLDSSIESIYAATQNLRFPILLKPKSATSTTESHLMKLVTSPEQLAGVATPAMLQEFVNHNGVVYKIYALDGHLEAGVRPSIRNIAPGEIVVIDFHSQHSEVDNGLWTKPRDLSGVAIPFEEFRKVSELLRSTLKLHLIGFDILIDEQHQFWLVDLNYFPGYKNIDDLWAKFLRFFLGIINAHSQ